MIKRLRLFSGFILLAALMPSANLYGKAQVTYTVETSYDRWKICISIPSSMGVVLKLIELINDPYEDFYDRPPAGNSAGYVYRNVRFDPKNDPYNKGEVLLTDHDTSICITVLILDPTAIAYAPLHIVTSEYADKFIELTNKPLAIKAVADRSVTHGLDTLTFPSPIIHSIGLKKDSCTVLHFTTKADLSYGYEKKTLSSIALVHNDGNFKLLDFAPKTLKSIDSFDIRICCISKDTLFHTDKIVVSIDCFDSIIFSVTNQGNVQILQTEDLDFSTVLVNESNCKSVTLHNRGSFPFRLYQPIITNRRFTLSQASVASLPKLLQVGDSLQLGICYAPIIEGFDTTTIQWNTDITPPLHPTTESSSFLIGVAAKPSVHWSTGKLLIYADSGFGQSAWQTTIQLSNRTIVPCDVELVSIQLDSYSEFSISGNSFGYDPLQKFRLYPADSIWVAVRFSPDTSIPFPLRHLDRKAKLAATYYTDSKHSKGESVLIDLVGTFAKPLSVSAANSGNRPLAYVQLGNSIVLYDSLQQEYLLSDLLGRAVKHWGTHELQGRGSQILLPLPEIPQGLYILSSASGRSQKLFLH